jgi:uncharacterized protein
VPIHGEISKDPHPPVADRKLGDEWEDWDGTLGSGRTEAPAGVFLGLAAGVTFLAAGLGLGAWWLAAPRLAGLGLRTLGLTLTGLWLAYLGAWLAGLLLGVGGVRAGARTLRALGGLGWSIGPAVALGRALGLGRDRVGHAFVRVHNRLEVLPPLVPEAERLLVLVPRCLSREVMQGLQTLRGRYGFSQLTVTGGTEARRAIAQQRPRGIVAVACERDLLAGVRDVGGRVPVLAFPNLRPEGPCKNTTVDLVRVEEAVRRFLGRT